ncbi:MAG TPA: acyl-CoA dehydratase activase-related protein [Sphingomicrobium sp.]|nr:acyl-CoA dehydratase activase-related protein [Sphingomicrobium sp.]
MSFPTLARWFAIKPSGAPSSRPDREARAKHRIGIPKLLNVWTTHQFWLGFFGALGIPNNRVVFSSDTSEEQMREYGRGRGTVDCCYPVKCGSGHYGELVFGQKRKIDILFSPMIYSLASFLDGHVMNSLACPRVMAGPENVKAGFIKEKDVFAENGIRYVSPLVSLGERKLVPKQLFEALRDVIEGLTYVETVEAVAKGYRTLAGFNDALRAKSREVLEWCAREEHPCIMVLARPYHMDSGIGHEIEADLQAYGYPILWMQYFPLDDDLMQWIFHDDLRQGYVQSPFDIDDVWPSSYSANTNEILWGAKVAARVPWITCAIRLTSYECGMDQPTFTPVQQIVERSGTLFFSFQELDSTKPAGSVKIRTETISHYLERSSREIIEKKRSRLPDGNPLLEPAVTAVT